jgi:hypothetical protein
MDAATTIRLEVAPLAKHIGAEIRGIDFARRPDPVEHFAMPVVVHTAMKS